MTNFYNFLTKKALLSLLIVLFSMAGYSATYYVSSTGSDTNSGLSESAPWKTISKVNSSSILPGDFVLFKRGNVWLNDQILSPRSGNSSSRVTYGAYGTGDKPILRKHAPISGWNVASNWTQEGNAWYKASSDIWRLWINGVEVLKKQSLPVSSSNKFYCGNGRLYIYSATNPATTFNNISSVNGIYLIHATGVNYVTISNLDLQGGGNAVVRMVGCSNWIFDGCNIGLHTSGNGIAANASSLTVPCNNNTVKNCRFVTGSAGTWGWEAKYNGDGILLSYGCNGWNIYDNYFANWGHNSYGLINMTSSSYTSSNNKFHHNYCTAPDIDYGRAWGYSCNITTDSGNEVYDNIFYNLGVMSQINGPNFKVYRNIFNKVRSVPFRLTVAQGLNFDGYSNGVPKNCDVYNNVFAYCDNAGILLGLGGSTYNSIQGNKFRNNIIYECDKFYNYAIRVSDSPYNLGNTWQNNLVYKTGYTEIISYKTARYTASGFNALNGIDGSVISGNIYGDPMFVNPTAGDFNLRAGSPAIDAGYSSSPLDPDGSRADIGVHYFKKTTTASFTFTGPASGNVNSASSSFTVTPNSLYTGTITITPSGTGSTGLSAKVLTFTNSSAAQTFTITPTTAGTITLTATNSGGLTNPGSLNYTANAVAPGAPTSVVATAGNASATVTFAAPANKGGSAITGYTVTSIPAGGTDINAGSTSLTHTITGLTNGISYTFTVKATNAAGTSVASAPSNSVIPKAVTAVAATSYTLTGPSSGNVNSTSGNFTVTPNNLFTGTITITPTGAGSTGLTAKVLTFTNSSAAQTFTITPKVVGSITLTATNNAGMANPASLYYTSLNIAPGAPTSVVATAGNASATVTFVAPASNGGSAITGYTVTSIPSGGIDINAGSTSLTHTITGLTNGTAYAFTVKAINAAGTSVASAPSNLVIPKNRYKNSLTLKSGEVATEISSDDISISTDIYPNPSAGRITVRFSKQPEEGSSIYILDSSGRKVTSRDVSDTTEEFDLEDQPAGIYFIKTTLGTNESTQRLIINK